MPSEMNIEALTSRRSVPAHDVAAALRELWEQAELDQVREGEAPVVRACGLTVIGWAEEDDELQHLSSVLARATGVVPSRTLLVQTAAQGVEGGLAAAVSAFCQLGRGGRQVCQEQVHLLATRERAADLPSLITPLPVADLPVVLVVARPDFVFEPMLDRLLPVVDVLILDSAGFHDVHRLFRRLHDLHFSQRVLVRDLAYERLAPWRETIADVYDHIAGVSARVQEVEATCLENDAEGSLLLGWIESRFPRGSRPTARLRREAERAGDTHMSEIRIVVENDAGRSEIRFERHGGVIACTRSDDALCELPRPLPDNGDLLLEILLDPQEDRVYEQALDAVIERYEA